MHAHSIRTSWLFRLILSGVVGLCGFVAHPAWSVEHVVRMLNAGTDGPMVFEPAFVRAQVGDTLRFELTTTGHFVRSLAVPDGVTPWLSVLDQAFVVPLEREGLYFYNCPPHLMMGMVGLIQVGEAVNRTNAIEVMKSTQGRIYSHGARIDTLQAHVK